MELGCCIDSIVKSRVRKGLNFLCLFFCCTAFILCKGGLYSGRLTKLVFGTSFIFSLFSFFSFFLFLFGYIPCFHPNTYPGNCILGASDFFYLLFFIFAVLHFAPRPVFVLYVFYVCCGAQILHECMLSQRVMIKNL